MLEETKWAELEPHLVSLNVRYFRIERVSREVELSIDLKPAIFGVLDMPITDTSETRFAPNGGRCEVSFMIQGYQFRGVGKFTNDQRFDPQMLLDLAITDAFNTATIDRERREAIAQVNGSYTEKASVASKVWALKKF